MTEAATINPPTSEATLKLPKDRSQESIWSTLSRTLWGPEKNERFRETTPEEMAQWLINSGRDPSDKCLPLVRLYDSEEQAQIDACRGKQDDPKDFRLTDYPMP